MNRAALLADLRHVLEVVPATKAHRAVALGFIFVSVCTSVYQSTEGRRGMLRRIATGYVAGIDAQQKAMFVPPSGAAIGWTQVALVISILILYGVFPQNTLLLVALATAIVPPFVIARRIKARRARIDEQAHGFALALANSLKSTASIGDALKGAADVTAKPLGDELGTAIRQIRVGSTLEEALLALSARVGSTALDVVVSALLIGRQTGGDLPRILEGTSSSLRELKRLEEMTDQVSRGAKQSLGIAASLTIALVIGLPYMMPGFFDPMKETMKGQFISAQIALVYCFALFLGYRITRKSI